MKITRYISTTFLMLVFLSGCGSFEVRIETPAESQTVPAITTPGPVPDLTLLPSSPPEVISRSNLDHVTQLAMLGQGTTRWMALSPDGQTLALASSAGIWLYEAHSLQPQRLLEGHRGEVYHVAWSPDGQRLVSAGGDNTLRTWETDSGALLSTLASPYGAERVEWSGDGAYLASLALDGTVNLWEAESGQPFFSFERPPECRFVSIAWLPGSATLSMGCRLQDNDGRVTLWSAESRQQVGTLVGLEGLSQLSWSPHGNLLASACADGVVRVWPAESGEALIPPISIPVEANVAWSPDGAWLAWGSQDGNVALWSLVSSALPRQILSSAGDFPLVVWSSGSDQLLVAHSSSGTLELLDSDSGNTLASTDLRYIIDYAWSPESLRLAAITLRDKLQVWEYVAGNDTLRQVFQSSNLPQPGTPLRALAWSSDATYLATAGADNLIRLWDAEKGEYIREFDNQAMVVSLAWRPGSLQLAAWGGEYVRLWDATDGQLIASYEFSDYPGNLVWSPDGVHLAGYYSDGQVWAWEVGSAMPKQAPELNVGAIRRIAWSPDGAALAIVGDGGLGIWPVASSVASHYLQGFSLLSAAWRPDGNQMAFGTDYGELLVWDSASGEILHTLPSGSSVLEVGWSPDGKLLASAGDRLRLWDGELGQLLNEFDTHSGASFRLAWSPDGGLIASTGIDQVLRVWGVASQ